MARWGAALAIAATVVLAGCGDGEGDDAAPTSTTAATVTSTTVPPTTELTVPPGPRPGAGTTFCDSMLQMGELGASGGGPEAAVDEAAELLDLLAEAQVNTPEDAPPQLDQMIDDFRAVAEALIAAEGDVEAAYDVVEANDPEAWARFTTSGARDDAYEFLAVHCGTLPG